MKYDSRYTQARQIADLAFERGRNGVTFATNDEATHPVYDPAYTLGSEYRRGERVFEPHMLIGCGCAGCRIEKIVREAVR